QAEDGIRDGHVTGVQTCALPISWDEWRLRQRLAEAFVEVKLFQLHNWRTLSRVQKGLEPGPEGSALKLYWSEMSKRLHETAMARSEERRVGKEVRGGRWRM